LTRFFIWLEENIPAGKVTELNIAEKLREYRSQQDLYHGESFGTIAGFADHGAMNHYKADEKSSYTITPDNILLIDSGGQYFDGTTDITRTISTGNPTPMQKLDYTLVLKGHIGLATIVFPAGTRGSQLDILARKAMWVRRMNYGHGTGHGIGHFLNVHEGPQNIRAEENPVVLEPGMIISNEPGMYRDGIHGFRTENLILVTEDEKTDFGRFLKFETLTLFPIETNLIEMSLMTEDEIIWLNDYHQMVYDRISPSLTASERKWLSEKTRVL
jgi:Xaa-Pro aminopeptidase